MNTRSIPAYPINSKYAAPPSPPPHSLDLYITHILNRSIGRPSETLVRRHSFSILLKSAAGDRSNGIRSLTHRFTPESFDASASSACHCYGAHNWSSLEMEMIVVTLLLAALLGVLFLYPRYAGKGKREGNLQTIAKEKLKTYTKDEVCLHNKRDDCWIIVKDKVYNVTPYVEEHPGGDAILNHAGGDSTEGFYGPQHATRVFDMVDEFYIGDVKL